MNICDYTTLISAKSTYTDIVSTQNDAMILSLIRQASREIEDITNRHFYPRIETHLFDMPRYPELVFDDDLLELTSLTNGDGTALAAGTYRLYPLNKTPKTKAILLPSAAVWLPDPSGNREGAIVGAGVWGFHDDYAAAWEDTAATLSGSLSGASLTATVPAALIHPGDLLKIDAEYAYVVSLSTAAATDTLTLRRAINGSTPAIHNAGAAVLRWNAGADLVGLINRAVAAYTKLRANPLAETVSVDGMTFNTPRDVLKYMGIAAAEMGLIRVGAA